MPSIKTWKWVALSLRLLMSSHSSGKKKNQSRSLRLERLDARYLLVGDVPSDDHEPLAPPPDATAPGLHAPPIYGPLPPPTWQSQSQGYGSGYGGSGSGYGGSSSGYGGSGSGYGSSGSGYAGFDSGYPGGGYGSPSYGNGYPGYDSGYPSYGSDDGGSSAGYGGSGNGYTGLGNGSPGSGSGSTGYEADEGDAGSDSTGYEIGFDGAADDPSGTGAPYGDPVDGPIDGADAGGDSYDTTTPSNGSPSSDPAGSGPGQLDGQNNGQTGGASGPADNSGGAPGHPAEGSPSGSTPEGSPTGGSPAPDTNAPPGSGGGSMPGSPPPAPESPETGGSNGTGGGSETGGSGSGYGSGNAGSSSGSGSGYGGGNAGSSSGGNSGSGGSSNASGVSSDGGSGSGAGYGSAGGTEDDSSTEAPEPLPSEEDSDEKLEFIDLAINLDEDFLDENPKGLWEPLPATVKEGQLVSLRATFEGPDDMLRSANFTLLAEYEQDGMTLQFVSLPTNTETPKPDVHYVYFGFPAPDNRLFSSGASAIGVMDLELIWYDEVAHGGPLSIENVAPRFTRHTEIATINDQTTIKLAAYDVDAVSAEIRWGDGVRSYTNPARIQSTQDWITAERPTPADTGALYPVQITARDNQGGKSAYFYDKVDVAINNNDDDGNEVPDMHDRTVVGESDLIPYSLAPFMAGAPDGSIFYITYDLEHVRVWDSVEKNNLIFSGKPLWETEDPQQEVEGISMVPTTRVHTGIDTVWVEGVVLGEQVMSVDRAGASYRGHTPLGRILVRTWGIDVDVDSSNREPYAGPLGTDYEEWLEDHPYAIGKLVFTDSKILTPMVIRLPTGLNPAGSPLKVNVEFDGKVTDEMQPRLFRLPESDKKERELKFPAWTIQQGLNSLQDIGYDPQTGEATLYISVDAYAPWESTKKEVDDEGSHRVGIRISLAGIPGVAASDRVQILPTKTGGFYHVLQQKIELRAAIAAGSVYGVATDAPAGDPYLFGLRRMHQDELEAKGLSRAELLLFRSEALGGIKAAVYQDMTATEPSYILAFAGTQSLENIVVDVMQAIGIPDPAYMSAGMIGIALDENREAFGEIVVAGHSLGGGLATQAAVAGNHKAYTFNTAALALESVRMLYRDDQNEKMVTRFHDRRLAVTDYISTYDLLNNIQDKRPELPSAGGSRINMQGRHDRRIARLEWMLEKMGDSMFTAIPRADLKARIETLKAMTHQMDSVYFGIMTHLSPDQDILGY